MRLLAIDLAWSGPSGWVLVNFDLEDPILDYDEICISCNSKKGIERDQTTTILLYKEIRSLLNRQRAFYEKIVFEYTDWHRSISGKNAKKEYAIERRAQRTLGMAVSVITLAAWYFLKESYLMPLGANEARREFGATRKDSAAHLWTEQYPRFEFREHKTGFLFDRKLKQNVSDHISDAFVLAAVADNRLRLEEKIDAVGRSE